MIVTVPKVSEGLKKTCLNNRKRWFVHAYFWTCCLSQ
jgi:hypothetical protein